MVRISQEFDFEDRFGIKVKIPHLDRERRYQLVLLDESGREVDSLSKIPEHPDLLEDLYKSARRDALGANSLIDTLLKNVEKSAS
jgi:hypothetical protein